MIFASALPKARSLCSFLTKPLNTLSILLSNRYYEPFVAKVKPDYRREVFPSSWMRSDRPVTKIMWLKHPGCLLVVGSSGVEVLQIANGWEIDLPFAKALKRLRGISAVACSPGVHAPPCLWLVDRQRRM